MFLAVMAVAAMGPGRSDAPPESVVPPVRPSQPASGAAWPTSQSPEPAAPGAAAGQPAAVGDATLHILPASEAAPATFLWQARPLVIFADTAADPAFIEQLKRLERDPAALITRDVVVITDTDPAANSEWRQQLHPRGFSLVLLDKDGQVKQRKPSPWTVREISRAIDKFPLRRQEIGRAGVLP
ncbi:MAG: DUF4174 domain-containing protein [Paracoccus sp. (in: a-proteobacteria)]|uniref:DUF4174 domain-containing protein n=1 Tax=Paracoccus sp. TaxID=267 RepID=UPI0026DFB43C|nr:DUF4174 domain-containing protein [Paracoccus sp. (in: a-proteobacteria)]MDO5631490.1 DUF4174 domain-containing protein [Paracoccus sp. (in: a-proteobacteria)]